MKLVLTLITLFLLSFYTQIYAQEEVIVEIPHAETENSFLLDGVRSSSFWARSKILPELQIDEAAQSSADGQCQIEVVENNSLSFNSLNSFFFRTLHLAKL